MNFSRPAAAVSTIFLMVGVIYWIQSPQSIGQKRSTEGTGVAVAKDQATQTSFQQTAPTVIQEKLAEGSTQASQEALTHRKSQATTGNSGPVVPEQMMGGSHGKRRPAITSGTEDDASASEAAVTGEPVGIRLANDVRLPAAALPVDFKMSPVAEKMLKEIVDDFYRELAGAVESTPDDHGIQTGDEGPTVVVSNGSIVDAARKRADYRFRALFGNAAYNRMTMNSVLESHLPVAQQPADGTAGAE